MAALSSTDAQARYLAAEAPPVAGTLSGTIVTRTNPSRFCQILPLANGLIYESLEGRDAICLSTLSRSFQRGDQEPSGLWYKIFAARLGFKFNYRPSEPKDLQRYNVIRLFREQLNYFLGIAERRIIACDSPTPAPMDSPFLQVQFVTKPLDPGHRKFIAEMRSRVNKEMESKIKSSDPIRELEKLFGSMIDRWRTPPLMLAGCGSFLASQIMFSKEDDDFTLRHLEILRPDQRAIDVSVLSSLKVCKAFSEKGSPKVMVNLFSAAPLAFEIALDPSLMRNMRRKIEGGSVAERLRRRLAIYERANFLIDATFLAQRMICYAKGSFLTIPIAVDRSIMSALINWTPGRGMEEEVGMACEPYRHEARRRTAAALATALPRLTEADHWSKLLGVVGKEHVEWDRAHYERNNVPGLVSFLLAKGISYELTCCAIRAGFTVGDDLFLALRPIGLVHDTETVRELVAQGKKDCGWDVNIDHVLQLVQKENVTGDLLRHLIPIRDDSTEALKRIQRLQKLKVSVDEEALYSFLLHLFEKDFDPKIVLAIAKWTPDLLQPVLGRMNSNGVLSKGASAKLSRHFPLDFLLDGELSHATSEQLKKLTRNIEIFQKYGYTTTISSELLEKMCIKFADANLCPSNLGTILARLPCGCVESLLNIIKHSHLTDEPLGRLLQHFPKNLLDNLIYYALCEGVTPERIESLATLGCKVRRNCFDVIDHYPDPRAMLQLLERCGQEVDLQLLLECLWGHNCMAEHIIDHWIAKGQKIPADFFLLHRDELEKAMEKFPGLKKLSAQASAATFGWPLPLPLPLPVHVVHFSPFP